MVHFSTKIFPNKLKPGLYMLLLLTGCSFQAAFAQTPVNIDFSMGNFTNWTCWVGSSAPGATATGSFFDSARISAPIGGHAPGVDPSTGAYYMNTSRHFITSGTDTDYYGGFPIVCPAGGSYSLRLGNDSSNFRADRVTYTVHVPASASSFNLQLQYAIVMQDPPHPAAEQPTFQVTAYDSATGTVLPAANNLYIAHYNFPGFQVSHASLGNLLYDTVFYLPWTSSTINLSGMSGQTVIVECTALDCAQGGHYCYGYFDVISSANSLSASLISYNSKGDSARLEGPPGYKSYHWYNQDFSQQLNAATDSSRIKTLPTPATPQYYNLVITPYASIGVPDTIQSPVLKAKPAGIFGPDMADIRVFPNPAASVLHIEFPVAFDGNVSLWNLQGQKLYKASVLKTNVSDIPVSTYPNGTYQLVIDDGQGHMQTLSVSIKH